MMQEDPDKDNLKFYAAMVFVLIVYAVVVYNLYNYAFFTGQV